VCVCNAWILSVNKQGKYPTTVTLMLTDRDGFSIPFPSPNTVKFPITWHQNLLHKTRKREILQVRLCLPFTSPFTDLGLVVFLSIIPGEYIKMGRNHFHLSSCHFVTHNPPNLRSYITLVVKKTSF